MLHVLEHALIDSLKVFAFVFILYFALTFFEKLINEKLSSKRKYSPLIGSLLGLIPQCGVSIAASDLYLRRRITIGTLISIFLACNDEAIFILLASDKALSVIPLLIIKFIVGFVIGFIIDIVFTQKINNEEDDINHNSCHHHNKKLDNKFLHTLFHSFEIFIYVLIVNIFFGTLIHYIGEDTLLLFFENNKIFNPLFAVIIGLIPNCSSSIILSELFIMNGISFGALLAGLLVNAGLGLIYLFKDKKNLFNNIKILLILIIVSLVIGYLSCAIIGF